MCLVQTGGPRAGAGAGAGAGGSRCFLQKMRDSKQQVIVNCRTLGCLEGLSLPSFCAIFARRSGSARWKYQIALFPVCYSTTVAFTLLQYYLLFGECEPRKETKTLNLLSKKRPWKMQRRTAAKANLSRSVFLGHGAEGCRHALNLPLHLSPSLHHLPFHVWLPRLSSISSGPGGTHRLQPRRQSSCLPSLTSGTSRARNQRMAAMHSMLA